MVETLERSFAFRVNNLTKSEERHHGANLRVISGVASTQNPDQMTETLLRDGMDFSPLLKSGFLNWDHQDSQGPEFIIGEPLEARSAMHAGAPAAFVKGFLYDDSAKADACWKLMDTLENLRKANRSTRRLGMSVQGATLARSNNTITQCVVRQLALTHQPINADTYANIGALARSLAVGNSTMTVAGNGALLKENLAGMHNGRVTLPAQPGNARYIMASLMTGCAAGYTHTNGAGQYPNGLTGAMHHLVKCQGYTPADARTSLHSLHRAGYFGRPRAASRS